MKLKKHPDGWQTPDGKVIIHALDDWERPSARYYSVEFNGIFLSEGFYRLSEARAFIEENLTSYGLQCLT